MTKYVFLNCPLHGHVNPTLPVIQELVVRGEEVIYYLTEEFRQTVEATGATLRVYTSSIGNGHIAARPPTMQNVQAEFSTMKVEEAALVIPQVLDSVREDMPDIIVYDPFCFWALIVSRKLQIPAILLCPGFALNAQEREKVRKQLMLQLTSQEAIIYREKTSILIEKMKNLCNIYNVEPFDFRSMLEPREGLNIVFLPREFQPGVELLDQSYCFVGPAIQPNLRMAAFPLERLKDQKNLYISLGTVLNHQVDFFNNCLQAFGDTHWQVVVALGDKLDREALLPIPANFIVQPYVPQLEVLRYSRVFITHGGVNSVMEALYYGIPLLVTSSQVPDQVLTAQRVTELGLGMQLDKAEFTPEKLREAVERIAADSATHVRVKQMQHIIRNSGGQKAAADAIIAYSETRRMRP